MSSPKRCRPGKNLVLLLQAPSDRWWQSLDSASVPACERQPGGGIAPKLMLYVWGFVWRSNLPHANLTKELAAINLPDDVARPKEEKYYFCSSGRNAMSRKPCKNQYKNFTCSCLDNVKNVNCGFAVRGPTPPQWDTRSCHCNRYTPKLLFFASLGSRYFLA